MRRLLALLVLVGGMVAVGGGTAWACTCAGPESQREHYRGMAESSYAVYTGTVLGPYRDGGYDVRVERVLKGTVSGTRHLRTADNGAACGAELEPGRVFLDEHRQGETGLCTGTTQEDVDGEVERYEHYNGGPTLPRTGAGGLPFLLTLTVVAGAALVLRARRA